MTRETFQLLDGYMRSCVCDSMHDPTHIYRVLARALKIAETEPGVCPDVLIAACLLHDIARSEQYDDPRLCHAQEGGRKATAFLRENGFEEPFIQKVCACIQTHRYRTAIPPQSIEAKILFDADKLDTAGAMGIARTLMFQGKPASRSMSAPRTARSIRFRTRFTGNIPLSSSGSTTVFIPPKGSGWRAVPKRRPQPFSRRLTAK